VKIIATKSVTKAIMKKNISVRILYFFLAMFVTNNAIAALPAYKLLIKNGHFDPEIITVPAHTRFKLVITNLGPGPEEFESKRLRKESVIAEGVTRTVVFAPLKPGEYSFFGEFHLATAKGRIVVE
jgi:cupredoxin-like protein